jgi:flavin reductase (DIM6/NTAB) family NADH-FMN oxidoreductase RutF
MSVGSFTSVSLDPPLVAFIPDRKSTSWPRIAATERFCVNILARHQEPLCRAFASRSDDKFAGVPYRLSDAGLPILDDVVAWIDCDLHAVHAAGDHFIVLGEVHSLDVMHPHTPLLFFQGGYGHFSPLD